MLYWIEQKALIDDDWDYDAEWIFQEGDLILHLLSASEFEYVSI